MLTPLPTNPSSEPTGEVRPELCSTGLTDAQIVPVGTITDTHTSKIAIARWTSRRSPANAPCKLAG